MKRERDTLTLSPTKDGPAQPSASRAPLLFLGLESHRPLAPSARFSLARFGAIGIGRGPVRSYDASNSTARSAELDIRVDDGSMSSNHARIFKVLGSFAIEDLGSKNGTRVNGERITRAALADGDVIELGRTFFIYRNTLETFPNDPPILEVDVHAAAIPGLATLVPSLARAYENLAAITRAGLPVLITGETGTGKEVLAQAIHTLSSRAGPFVALNCAALPETLVEAELFGHRRGAFSDAKEDRPGLVRTAHHGTLFLDEMGELRPPAQAALLRVLEEREVRSIGATAPVSVDVRFVSATNRSLDKMVAAGSFRADLFHRLAGHIIELLPLRARREDLGLLVAARLKRHLLDDASNIRLQPAAVRLLFSYGFPGNVRELDKVLHAALALSHRTEIGPEHLPTWNRSEPVPNPPTDDGEPDALRENLIRLFHEHNGNVSAVARAMGKARMQVQRWMKRYGIDAGDYSR